MWIKVMFASLLSGIFMGFFLGFGYRSSGSIEVNSSECNNNTALGNWVRALRWQLFRKYPGWKMVAIQFLGLSAGIFGPLYIFFHLPLFSCRLTEIGFATYLLLGMIFFKGTDLL